MFTLSVVHALLLTLSVTAMKLINAGPISTFIGDLLQMGKQ